MNIDQLRHFSEIARCGSLNQATEALYISQPSLSASVKKLEMELGEPVFTRHSTGVSLTPFGEELLPYVRNVLNLLDQLPSRIYGKNAHQRLSVAGGGFRYMSAIVAKLYANHREEGIYIDYFDVTKSEGLSMVAAGTAQVGGFAVWDFQMQHMKHRLEELNVEFVPLAVATPTVAVGPHHPLFHREEEWVTQDMIQEYPVLNVFSEHANSLYKKLGIVPGKNVINCRNRAGRGEILSYTDCVSLGAVPAQAYRKTEYYSNRRVFQLKGCDYVSEVGYIPKKSSYSTPMANEFKRLLHELFE